MSDVVVLLALAAVVALVGIGAGILDAGPLDRFVNREEEGSDDPDGIPAQAAERPGGDRLGELEPSVENEEDA